jgi:hypothetical protein
MEHNRTSAALPSGERATIGLNLADQQRAARLLADLRLLLRLDDLWTQYLTTVQTIPDDDFYDLQSVNEQMRGLLEEISRNADWLQTIASRDPQVLEVAWSRAVSRFPASEENRRTFQARITRAGGFAEYAQGSVKKLREVARDEMRSLAEKLRVIASGNHSPGDLSAAGRCALLGAGAVLAFATGQFEIAGWLGVIGANDCLGD